MISKFTDWYTRLDIDDGIRLYVAIRCDPYSLDNNTNFDLQLLVDTKLYSNCNIGLNVGRVPSLTVHGPCSHDQKH